MWLTPASLLKFGVCPALQFWPKSFRLWPQPELPDLPALLTFLFWTNILAFCLFTPYSVPGQGASSPGPTWSPRLPPVHLACTACYSRAELLRNPTPPSARQPQKKVSVSPFLCLHLRACDSWLRGWLVDHGKTLSPINSRASPLIPGYLSPFPALLAKSLSLLFLSFSFSFFFFLFPNVFFFLSLPHALGLPWPFPASLCLWAILRNKKVPEPFVLTNASFVLVPGLFWRHSPGKLDSRSSPAEHALGRGSVPKSLLKPVGHGFRTPCLPQTGRPAQGSGDWPQVWNWVPAGVEVSTEREAGSRPDSCLEQDRSALPRKASPRPACCGHSTVTGKLC